MTQDEIILEALKRGDKITQLEATHKYGITRLASVIHRLRHLHIIDGPDREVRNRHGKKCFVAQYEYKGPKT